MAQYREISGIFGENAQFFGNLSLKLSEGGDTPSKDRMNPGKQADSDGKTALFWGIWA